VYIAIEPKTRLKYENKLIFPCGFIYLSGFITAVVVFRKPNALPICLSIDPYGFNPGKTWSLSGMKPNILYQIQRCL